MILASHGIISSGRGGIFSAYAARVAADGGVTEAGSCVDAVSTLLQSASLLLAPSGYKSGKVYAEIPTNGNGDLTFTRASTAVRTNSAGLLESMATGVPRLSYMYGSCPSVLLEPQRTNLALWSEDFTNSVYGKTGLSVSPNTITAPDGTLNADSLVEDTSTGLHFFSSTITVVSGSTYTGTIYLKANTRTRGRFRLNDTGGQPATDGNFDLSAGTISSGSITNVGNGWYRLSLTRLMGSTSGSFVLFLADSSGNISYTGNGSSLFAFGAQFEAGAYATTYIPTTTATVTRIADSFSRNNIYTNGLITSSGGTWFVELRNNAEYVKDSGDRGLFLDTSNTGNTNGFQFVHRNTGGITQRILINKRIGGADTIIYQSSVATIKIAIKWNGTSADIFANGTKVVTATSFTTTAMEFLNFTTDGVPFFIQQMALYSSPLSDTDCTTITTL